MRTRAEFDILPQFAHHPPPDIINMVSIAAFLGLINLGMQLERERLRLLSRAPGSGPEIAELFTLSRMATRRLDGILSTWPRKVEVAPKYRLVWTAGSTCYLDGIRVFLAPQAMCILALLVRTPGRKVDQDQCHAVLDDACRRSKDAKGTASTLRGQVMKCFVKAFKREGKEFDPRLFQVTEKRFLNLLLRPDEMLIGTEILNGTAKWFHVRCAGKQCDPDRWRYP